MWLKGWNKHVQVNNQKTVSGSEWLEREETETTIGDVGFGHTTRVLATDEDLIWEVVRSCPGFSETQGLNWWAGKISRNKKNSYEGVKIP